MPKIYLNHTSTDDVFEVFEEATFTGLIVYKEKINWIVRFASYFPDEDKSPLWKEVYSGALPFLRFFCLLDVVTYLQNKKNKILTSYNTKAE